jgi:hypothetical protein
VLADRAFGLADVCLAIAHDSRTGRPIGQRRGPPINYEIEDQFQFSSTNNNRRWRPRRVIFTPPDSRSVCDKP